MEMGAPKGKSTLLLCRNVFRVTEALSKGVRGWNTWLLTSTAIICSLRVIPGLPLLVVMRAK